MGAGEGNDVHPEHDGPQHDGEAEKAEKAEKAFVDGLVARGEAAEPDENGELPPGATHELVRDEAGRVTVRRRRFSAF